MKRTATLSITLIALLCIGAVSTRTFGGDPANYIFSASRLRAEVTVIDTATDVLVRRIALPAISNQVIALDRGRRLAVGDPNSHQVHFIDVLSGRVERSVDVPIIPEILRGDRTGTMLALLDYRTGSLALMWVASGATWSVPDVEDVKCVVFDTKGRLLVADRDGVAIVNATGRRETVLAVDPATGPVTEVAADPGGEYAFAVQADRGTILVFSLKNARRVAALRFPPPVGRLVPSPDSQFLLVPFGGHDVAVVSMWTLHETARIRAAGETSSVGLALSQSIATVISRSSQKLLIYDLRDRHPIADVPLPGIPGVSTVSSDGLKFYMALPESGQIAAVDLTSRPIVRLIDGISEGTWALVPAIGDSYCH